MAAGGAATSLPVLQFFEDIGIPIMEGYGLTETSPIVTAGECCSCVMHCVEVLLEMVLLLSLILRRVRCISCIFHCFGDCCLIYVVIIQIFFTGTVSWENRRLGCVGVPIPGVKVRIMDPETLQEMPSDTDGEVSA